MPRVVLLDSNLLLVWVVGSVDPALIPTFERTSSYSPGDFELLASFVDAADAAWVLPNTVTEVNSLLGKLKGDHKSAARRVLAQAVRDWHEEYIASENAVRLPDYAWLGLTDAAVILAAREGVQIATDDLHLYRELLQHRASAVNFTHLRTRDWL